MRGLDFSSWQTLLSTLLGLAVITLIGVGIRLLVMQIVQQRRERENRQINERLRTLIAAYKTLGGSFTGRLAVDPTHLRDLKTRQPQGESGQAEGVTGSERARRIRDAVEAALSDIILLGTDEQVRLAARAATDMVEGRPIRTDELVVSLRDFIRGALDLDPVPAGLSIPPQGPARPGSGGKTGRNDGGRDESRPGGGRGGNAGGGGAGMGMGLGAGMALGDDADSRRGG